MSACEISGYGFGHPFRMVLPTRGASEQAAHACSGLRTAKHVIDEAWSQLGRHTKRRFDSIAPFQIDAYHWPSQDGQVAIWGVDAVWDISFSDMALVRVRPSNDVAQTNHPGTVQL
jgi:hypothetical protein